MAIALPVKWLTVGMGLLLAGTLLPLHAATSKKSARKHSSGVVEASTKKSEHPSASSKKSSSHKAGHRGKKSKRASWRSGQQKIDSRRTREIQAALIREHYLEGQPSGQWDAATQKALQRYQGDHGWQTKSVPDSRALIKLGLGPNHDHLLNPESAMTMAAPSQNAGTASPAPPSLPSTPLPDPAGVNPQPQH